MIEVTAATRADDDDRPLVLLVDDDDELRTVLSRALAVEGFEVVACETGHAFVAAAHVRAADVHVIDIGLADADGRDVCQALRAHGFSAPTLFLTARDAPGDRVSGFHSGGDDYLVKPFDIAELSARLLALTRRAPPRQARAVHGLRLDPTRLTVAHADRSQRLSPIEFRLLAKLAATPGRAVSRPDLIAAAWGHGARVSDNMLDASVSRARRALSGLRCRPVLETVRGIGYRLQCA